MGNDRREGVCLLQNAQNIFEPHLVTIQWALRKSSRSVKLITHFQLVTRLRMSGYIPPLPNAIMASTVSISLIPFFSSLGAIAPLPPPTPLSGPWPPPHSRGFLWFLDHTRHTTVGRTPLDE